MGAPTAGHISVLLKVAQECDVLGAQPKTAKCCDRDTAKSMCTCPPREVEVYAGGCWLLVAMAVTHADVTCTKRWMTKPAHVTKSVARCWRTKVDEPSRWPPSCHGHGGQSGWPWRRGLGDVRMLSGCSIMSVVQWVLGASCIALNTQ